MAKILLSLENKENQNLLTHFLSQYHQVMISQNPGDFSGEYDLCIIDGPSLNQHEKELKQKKQQEAPYFVPVLLVTTRKDVGKATRQLWKVIDELIISPIEKVELMARVEVLLQTRRLSLESESWFKASLYGIGDAVITTDPKGNVRQLNAEAERLTGWQEKDAQGLPIEKIFNIINEETRKIALNPIKRILKEGVVLGLANHTILISKDGQEFPIVDSGAPIMGPDNTIIGAIIVFRDQTQERLYQKEIEEARQFAEEIIATLREALLVLDKDLCIVTANATFYKTFSLKAEQTIGQFFYQVGNGLFNNPQLKQLLEGILPQNTSFENFKISLDLGESGSRIFVLNARRIKYKDKDTKFILLAIEDKTDEELARQELQRSEKRNRIITNLISDYAYIFRVTPEGQLKGEWVTESFHKVFGLDIPQIDRMGGWQSLVLKEDLPLALQHAQKVAGGQADVCIMRWKTKNGDVRWLKDFAVPVKGENGRVVEIYGASQDITAEKQLEEQLRASERTFRELFLHAPIGLYRTRLSDGQLLECNEQFAKMFGFKTRTEALKSFNALNYYVKQEDRNILLSARSKEITEQTYVTELKRKDGTRFWARISTSINKKQGVSQGVIEDITAQKEAEDALRENEEKYRAIVENAHTGIVIIDNNFRITYSNAKFFQIIGYPENEVLGQDFRKFLTKESLDMVTERYLKRQRGEKVPATYEFTVRRKDGSERTLEINAAVLKNFRGSPITIAQLLDITERKAMEAALKEREERYRLIVENAHDGISISQDDRIIFCNKRFAEMLGYTQDELFNIPFTKVYSERGLEELYARQKLREQGKFISDKYETTFKKKDGGLINVEISYEIIDYRGRPATFAITRDITEKKRAYLEMERLKKAIEQAGEAIVITDLDGNIQYVNPAFENITGYSEKEVLGKNPRILKSGKHGQDFYKEMWDTITQGKTWYGRIINKRKDGELITEDMSISPIRNEDGDIVSYVAVKRDITSHLQLEQQFLQVQKMESVGRLAGGVAHDYNNMLTVILGNAQLGMTKTDENNPLYDYFAKIQEAARRSADITRQLLAFARKQTIEPRVLDLNETIEKMLKMLRRLIGENIELVWKPASQLWQVKMDPTQIDQILMNLVVNARDAIDGIGKITIETENRIIDEEYCSKHAGFTPGSYVMLAVSDNGCGMPPEILDKIFEPFFTTKETGKGTGLGLSTVYGVVKQNNGFINVYSEPGVGTTFRLYFPRHEGEEMTEEEMQSTELRRGKGEKIMIVEDDPAILEFASELLKETGYTVMAINRAKEAIQIVKTSKPKLDLLITDVVMPDMSGKELAEQIKKLMPDIKILYMSGYTANAIAHQGVLDEGVNYIQKPFSVLQMAAKVREVLGKE